MMMTSMQPKVVGIGELLWDLLPSGARMGGAPANFACHTQALGAHASVITRVGNDRPGQELIENLRRLGLSTDGVQTDNSHATGAVEVSLGEDGQPHYTILNDVAWDHLEHDSRSIALMEDADAVCFGTLGQRSTTSRESILRLVSATAPRAFRIFDVNLRQDYYSAEVLHQSLEIANVCKLGDSELPVVTDLLGIRGTVDERIATLVETYQLRMLIYTRGAWGSILTDGTRRHEHAGYPAVVKDTIGAGDSFTAAAAMGLLLGWPLDAISDTANALASHVCSCDGAIPAIPPALRQRFRYAGPDEPAGPEAGFKAIAV